MSAAPDLHPREEAGPGERGPGTDSDIERRLAEAIDPWLQHMRWRKDFSAWRDRRIHQEQDQGNNLRDVRSALGGRFADKKLLDLGAGMGGLTVAMMREFIPLGLRIEAIDYNSDYCRIARLRALRYGLNMPIVEAAGEHLPYGNAEFDAVVCLDVLEHVADAEAVLNEIYRVLKPGGVALTTVPNRHAFRDPHYHLPLINWLPRSIGEIVLRRMGRSKEGGPLQDRQGLSDLNTYSWGAFRRLASGVGFAVRDQVLHRITRGEVRQLRGWRRRVLNLAMQSGIVPPVYRVYRYGWEGTYQIMLRKPL
ncbi:MAG: class I SAM-dependent methyltransferase [Chloroflexota bacterium]|nr:class I SAM-dependent methyltransferase [Chloroflexota bacterium]